MSIVIAGASGRLGRLAARELLDSSPPDEVVLMSRSPEALDELAARGARVVRGDYGDAGSLRRAFDGAERLLMISASAAGDHDPVPLHRTAIGVAEEAGVARVVFTSFANPSEDNPAFPGVPNRQSERMLRESGLTWTVLRNAIYADMRVNIAEHYLATGRYPTNLGDGRHAFIWRADCAAAAVAALLSDDNRNEALEVTGPELVSVADYARLLEEFGGGRPVEVTHLSDGEHEAYLDDLRAGGDPLALSEHHWTTGRGIREGHMSQLTSDFEDLTGRRPRTLRALFEERAASQ